MSMHSFLKHLIAAMCLIFLATAFAPALVAQELFCDVGINYRRLQGSGFTFLDELEELAEEYLNDNIWTEDRFLEEERINCTMSIIFQESLSLTSFRAQLVVTSNRPIYGASATTKV